MTISNLQHQSQQISAIRKLIQESSAEELDLQGRVKANRASAEKKQQHDLAASQDTITASKEEALLKKTATLTKIDGRRELEPEILREKHEQRILQLNSEADEIKEKTEAKLNEATWLAESVFEGTLTKPRDIAQQAQNALEDAKEKLEALTEEAPKALSRLRQVHTHHEGIDTSGGSTSMGTYVSKAEEALIAIQSDPLASLFVGIRPAFLVGIVTATAVFYAGSSGWTMSLQLIGIPLGAMAIAILALLTTYAGGKNSVKKKLAEFTKYIACAKGTYDHSMELIDLDRRSKEKAITVTRDVELQKAEDKYRPRLSEVERLLKKDLKKEKEKFTNVAQRLTEKLEQDAQAANDQFDATMSKLDSDKSTTLAKVQTTYNEAIAAVDSDESETNERLGNRWKTEFTEFYADAKQQHVSTAEAHPSWTADWSSWDPRTTACDQFPIGNFSVDLTAVGGELPTGEDLQLNGERTLTFPLCATLPRDASILISSSGKLRDQGIALIQHSMLRVLTSIPPGKAKFILVDPVGLGQSFAGVLHLADYEESQLLDRAWTEARHIETQLATLTEHMETVIQKYLRNEFESIDQYNEEAGEIAEAYRFLVIADLPNNFSENAAKRLSSIITSGARCGVHVIIHRDIAASLPAGIDEDTLNRISMHIIEDDGNFCIDDDALRDLPLTLDTPPNEITTTQIVKAIGDKAEDTHRVEVPFSVIAPKEDEIWSRSTTDKLAIPLGRSGATKLQNLTLGRGTAQHVLIAGKTGSGKSTLLHVLITNLALWYSPDEVEFYLIDFKKGVEFKTYATHKLPHARVVAVESDREFGISVLQKIDAELKRRGELFRDLGVQDIAGFRNKSDDVMPRILLIVDEFQEFFIDDDRVAQEANLLLDRLVRQGRAFGIHAIMGSQTLDGAYSLNRSTMGQMAVRVALQCSEADSYIILNEDNAAARLLSRPGEAIYNDAAGKVEGNSPFQIVWLNEDLREKLLKDMVAKDGNTNRELVVYEGNQPVHLHENESFQKANADDKKLSMKAWLGGAMAIKEDTSATFRIASGSNLLIVGQQDETTTNMVANAMCSLGKQSTFSNTSLTLLDGTPADSTHATVLKEVAETIGCSTNLVGIREVEQAMQGLYTQLQQRMADGAADLPTLFLVINALHRFRDLRRNEDDFGFSTDEDKQKTPAQILAELIKEGPPLGMHVIIATDTLANLNRALDRQGIREFDMRVLLQMGGNDSTNLIDSPDASRLGMHRALLYSEETGTIEPFRPYALPDLSALASLNA